MGNFFRGMIRASSFFRKEIFEILRQPRLVATLVLGPFLILFVFGIGYRNQSRALRTLFAAQPNSTLAQEIQQNKESMGSWLIYAGATDDQKEALDRLNRGQVDLVIADPEDAYNTIKNNQQAIFTLYHHEIDPVQVSYIVYFGQIYVNALNQSVLRSFAVQGQKDAADLHNNLQEAHKNVSAMRQAVQIGDETLAQQKQQGLSSNVDAVSLAVGVSLGLLDSMQQTKGVNGGNADPAQSTLTGLRQNTNQLNNSSSADKAERLARIDKIDKDITDLDGKLAEFQSIDPSIIVSPFRSETKSIAPVQPSLSDFFAPAVLALLLQHLAVTFAALSIVRERNVGTMELFRVSPLSAAEALFGKYISYMLFGGVIAALLSALLIFVLHVPMLGNWWYFALVIATVLFTSLGIGFAISIVSQTDSQAVQYSMIILLASVFFSGFIMSLDMLLPPVRVISWLLPTTYGTLMLRDIALRGTDPNWLLLGGLASIGLGLMLISWRLMHRLISSSQ
ncbi:MAG: ABC transporter permease [Thermoflexales bacterium]|nr:ABC transporter permease [Thermoflexales bacterium]